MVVGTDGTYTLFTVEVEWVSRDVKIREYSLLLGGSIGVKVYVNLSHNAVLNLDDVKTTVDFMGITYDAVLENANNPDHETLYFAKFYVAAKEMHEDITFTVDALNTVESVTVSVKNYVDYINANSAEYADSIDLINAMYNYGEYSRKYCLGADITPNPDLAQTELTLSSDYTPTTVGSAQGIRIYFSSLLLESNTTIRHYFKLDDGASIDDYTFTLDGQSLVPTLKNGYYYVDITNIVAHKLGEMRTVEVSCGDETLKVIYSPLSYAKLVTDNAENRKDNLLTLVKALYNYYIESNEYAEYIERS